MASTEGLQQTGPFEHRVVFRPRPATGLQKLRTTVVLHSSADFRVVSLGQVYAIGLSMLWITIIAPFGLPQEVSIGGAVAIVLGGMVLVGYQRPVTRWELEITPQDFALVPVMVAADGRERADDRREPLVRGPLAGLSLGASGEKVRVGSGSAQVEIDAALSASALTELQDAIEALKGRYGDASMVPEALRRGVEIR